jgi:hypothetical protein
MKSLVSVTVGGPETLQLTEQPTAQPSDGEVLIEVKAAGVSGDHPLTMNWLGSFTSFGRARRVHGRETRGLKRPGRLPTTHLPSCAIRPRQTPTERSRLCRYDQRDCHAWHKHA